MTKRLFSCLLALCLLFAQILPISAGAEEADPNLVNAPMLEADVEATASIVPEEGQFDFFRFCPTVTESYTFTSRSDLDTAVYLVDVQGIVLAGDDDSGEGSNFALTAVLEAGQTYYWVVFTYSADTATFPVIMETTHSMEENIRVPSTCLTEGEMDRVCTFCGLTETKMIPAEHWWDEGFCTVCGAEFRRSGSCGTGVNWVLDAAGTLTLSGNGAIPGYAPFDIMYEGYFYDIRESEWTVDPAPWAEDSFRIKAIQIQPGITAIGDNAFWGLRYVQELVIPEGVVSLGYQAISFCTSLSSLSLPSTLETIDGEFSYCSKLKTIRFLGPVPRTNSLLLSDLTDGLQVYYSRSQDDWDWAAENWYQPADTTWHNIDVSVSPEDFAFTQTSLTLYTGKSVTVESNADPYVQSLLTRWTSSDPSVVLVSSNGTLTGIRAGTATVTASSEDGAYQASCTVTVQDRAARDTGFSLLTGEYAENQSYNNYRTWAYASTSWLAEYQGFLDQIQVIPETGVVVNRYTGSRELHQTWTLEPELPMVGGFFFGENWNFLVYGQTNPAQSDQTEVLRIVRYTKDWQRMDHCSIYGANTTVPFDAGTADFAETDGKLYLHTCHEMYTSSDGLNHQANMTFVIDQQTMTVVDQWYGVMNLGFGYVSHSFNQRIRTDGTHVFRADHGDAHPRSFVLTRANVNGSITNVRYLELFPFKGAIGENGTGASLGGMELSSTNCLVAGNSIDQSSDYASIYASARNIFLCVADQNLAGFKTVWLTNYAYNDPVEVRTPHLVKLSADLFLVMWEECQQSGQEETSVVIVNGEGETLTEVLKLECPLSDCQPMVTEEGLVCWFANTYQHMNLYELRWDQLLSDPEGVSQALGHRMVSEVVAPTCTERGYTYHYCESCSMSYSDSFTDPTGHEDGPWNIEYEPSCEAEGWRTMYCNRCFRYVSETLPALDHDYQMEGQPATCLEPGNAVYTCRTCGDSYREESQSPLGHDMGDWYVLTQPTCTKGGIEQQDCSRCGESSRRNTQPTGHSHSQTVTPPSCTEGGYTTYTCKCGDSYIANEVPALGHNMGSWYVLTQPTCTQGGIEQQDCSRCGESSRRDTQPTGHSHSQTVTPPSCTEDGYTTYTCKCGDSYTGDRTNALGHSFGNWVVEQAPSCTESGLNSRSCVRCSEKETQPVTPSGHHFAGGVCIHCGLADAKPVNPFGDVAESDYFFQPVLWAVEKGITAGTSPTTFAPSATCTRGQVVTFLWRAMGKPAPESTENPFTDVSAADYFYDAVLWAVEQGITAGTGGGKFSPNNPCTRDQVVTFLWRAMGKPGAENRNNPFSDVAAGAYYYEPVLWAVEKGITSGTSATTFAPGNPCTRGQVVTFLYRAMKDRSF